ncbi:S-adenosyl-L-methionine-dependent methyltransferase [Glonium stellatum]|uniref:S-adenosyl-L-methionine-dependent methyltransferase n=1 Tax=Glonium stellatum TaxID=574774 RepID=A0A8E2F0C1_9PEZI|nr:S-adenosyl-L-methionine-dependent methyltransferase [Glonium stellatum]
MTLTRATDLASLIASNTAKYNDYLLKNDLPPPSLDLLPPEAPLRLPDDISTARELAIEASHELHELLCGPIGLIMNAAPRSTRIMSLHFVHTYKVGYNLGWGEKTTFAQIAKDCNLDEEDTRRMLRLAMTDYLFTEPENGVVMHSAASYELARNPLLSAWIGVTVQENWSPMLKISEAISKYPGSEEPMESAYAIAHNLSEMPFKVWERDPKRIKQFSDAMAFLHSDSGFQPSHILLGCQFSGPDPPTFVDIGGSQGHVSISLARLHPNMKFIVQDTPQTVALGAEQLPEDLKDGVTFMAHDFWNEQPVKDADVYFFRCIFHDWSDKYSVRILRNLIPALKKGARVIISDVCIPPKGVVSMYKEHWIRGLDVVMKCFTNAKEREAGDWAALFTKADPRFKFLGVRMPPGSKDAVIEAEWTSAEDVKVQPNGSESGTNGSLGSEAPILNGM